MLGPIPAYGLYARNMRGLTATNMRFQTASADLRPAVILDRVIDAVFNQISVDANRQAESALRFVNCTDVLLVSPRLLNETATLLQLEGPNTERIILDGCDTTRAASPVVFRDGATSASIRIRD